MTLTVNLTPEMEMQLRDCLARQDVEKLRAIWHETFLPQVERQLQETPPPLSDEEFEALLSQIDEIMGDTPLPPNYDDSRGGIYQDHP
jgi:hypothetical protein